MFLPDFQSLEAVAHGLATNFDLSYSARTNFTGLVFRGYLKVPVSGLYSFFVESDDGARVEVGYPRISCIATGHGESDPPVRSLRQAMAERGKSQWTETEGEVTYVAWNHGCLQMELTERGARVPVSLLECEGLCSTDLLHRRIVVKGICQFSPDEGRALAGLVVPGAQEVTISFAGENAVRNYSTNDVLTTAGQVRRLRPEEAGLHLRARVKGVVIATTTDSVVLQDNSGGVFIHYSAEGALMQPAIGQSWELEGHTDPGDFSPVIFADTARFLGNTAMPDPIHPTWEQLMNGSLDAEYVEMRGVVTAVTSEGISLLTEDGQVTILGYEARPLPIQGQLNPDPHELSGCIISIRGCLTADWNWDTRQVNPGRFALYPGTIEIEEHAPANPFAISAVPVARLMWFNARGGTLQRSKVTGQVIYAGLREYYAMDGQTGFRISVKQETASPHGSEVRVGDLIEAVGFPKLGGPSLALMETQIRKTGTAPLPAPVPVSAEDLITPGHDSTRVQIQAELLRDVQQEERILELQAGPYRFLARLNSGQSVGKPLQPGSRLQLTGVYSSVGENRQSANLVPFVLLLNGPDAIRVLAQPPWWTVRRAVIMAGVLAGALGIAFGWITVLRRKVEVRTVQLQKEIEARQLVEQHRAMEQERIRVAQDLHDELGVGLTQVGLLSALARDASVPGEKRETCLEQLADSARSLVTSLDEIVWAINPRYDSVASLGSYYALFAQRFLNLAGIACRFESVLPLPERALDSKVRHGIFLAFKEALNNVVRHSAATEVRLKIQLEQDQLLLSVADNGCGLTPESLESSANGPVNGHNSMPPATPAYRSARYSRNGLVNMRRRMEHLGGTCLVQSVAGHGTTIQLSLKLTNNGT
jgi:signal transduction histidine kinase